MSKYHLRTCLALLAVFALSESGMAATTSNVPGGAAAGERRTSLGTISGSVLDSRGQPVAGALVKILRDGFNEVVKETRSAADGSFSARVTPGRYLIRALASGFTPATFTAVQIAPSTEIVYRFNLQPAGEGQTTPERRADRNDPKFRIRASQSRRSVFNAGEGDSEAVTAALGRSEMAEAADADTGAGLLIDESGEIAAHLPDEDIEERRTRRTRTKGFVETYFANSADPRVGAYAGLNFAVATPINRDLDLIFAGQLGEFERFETTARLRAGMRHRLSATVGAARLPFASTRSAAHEEGQLPFAAPGRKLGQVSVRAVDEWVVRDGIVLVLGLDYSRFLGAGDGASLSPRLGFAFDVDSRTRLRAAYAPGSDAASQLTGINFEDGAVLFRESPGQAVALVDGEAVLERSSRLEFGVERVVSANSTIEATAFFDTVDSRGVGLLSMPLEGLEGASDSALINVANQQGGARGLRVVYTRRISRHLKASAGYAFGRGQRLAPGGAQDGPGAFFQSAFFQTAAAQLDASISDDTTVRTVLRFSPRAAVFAIDPFAGRLAVYDPSLSILVTHELPNFGLPVRAQATLDARNVFDLMTGFEDGETTISLGALRRTVRGGISVRF